MSVLYVWLRMSSARQFNWCVHMFPTSLLDSLHHVLVQYICLLVLWCKLQLCTLLGSNSSCTLQHARDGQAGAQLCPTLLFVVFRYAGADCQPTEMAKTTEVLSTRLAHAASVDDGLKPHFARMSLAVLPRGGGAENAISVSMLKMLRDNGIKEGNRPGIEFSTKSHRVQFIEDKFLDEVPFY